MVVDRFCSFCKKKIAPGSGCMVATNSGNVLFFCSSKCKKNMLKLKRNPKKYKWSEGS